MECRQGRHREGWIGMERALCVQDTALKLAVTLTVKCLLAVTLTVLVFTRTLGVGSVEGFADDYAFLIRGLLDLYETGCDQQWLEWAVRLQEKQNELFWDEKKGGYFNSTASDPNIMLRMKEG